MLREGGLPVEVAGNIGRALSSLVGEIAPEAWVVCEVGVFQLDDMQVFRPDIGVLVNLAPDHLDRYEDFDAYAVTKLRMFELQTEDDTAIVPRGFRDLPGERASRVRGRRRAPGRAVDCGPHNRERRRRHRCRPRRRTDDDAIASAAQLQGVLHRIEPSASSTACAS
jgi:UDP-N-acetylmuramoylalanine-D-glutamate ligase